MGKSEELEQFLIRVDDFIESKYILADIKIVNLLKSIAVSETLLALFKNCLTDFDYEKAKKTYLVKSKYLAEGKGEYILPKTSREILAFTFNILLDFDAKRIELSDFVTKYFYEDGSFSSGYQAFINAMIKPFRNTVKMIMESVIEGKLQDPLDAITEDEERRKKEAEEREIQIQKDKELSLKSYGESIKSLREILLLVKSNIKMIKNNDGLKSDLTLIVDMLGSVIESSDKDAIVYAYTSYKYAAKCHPFIFCKSNKVSKLIGDVLNGI